MANAYNAENEFSPVPLSTIKEQEKKKEPILILLYVGSSSSLTLIVLLSILSVTVAIMRPLLILAFTSLTF